MLRTLYGRMAAALLVLFVALACFLVGVQVWGTQRFQLEANQRLNRDLAANLIGQGLVGPGGEVRGETLQDVFHAMMVVNPSIEVYLLDAQGRILTYSAPPGRVQMERISLDPVRVFLAPDPMLPVLGDDPRHPGRRTVFSAAPVGAADPPANYLYVVLAGEQYQTASEALRTSQVTRLAVGLVLAAAVAVLFAALVLFSLLTRRLRRLAVDVAGPAGEPPAAAGAQPAGDEVDRLEATFRRLTTRIQQQLEALRGADEERRRLVSNISHDLKTPLASMQGHLETLLLKEDKLGVDERRQYLQTAVSNAQRLGRLTTELFDLARLDAPEMRLEREAFPLAELVQDVVQKLRVALEQVGVEVAFQVPSALPPVDGDLGLVERAVENLLTNAVRHSPEGGAVQVAFDAAGGRVRLRVRDQGPGIPPDEFPQLFERFYRGGRSRARGEGTGLGLAIVRRIAELHGGRVTAANHPEGGAEFVLELPAA
ncbi:MAG: HAMP domain-containing sensor histidine kinase [Deferrisomatales bacterium]|nr:HAMP domain-containing sensor histidine kinase [Deferrisomatales bacterium]